MKTRTLLVLFESCGRNGWEAWKGVGNRKGREGKLIHREKMGKKMTRGRHCKGKDVNRSAWREGKLSK